MGPWLAFFLGATSFVIPFAAVVSWSRARLAGRWEESLRLGAVGGFVLLAFLAGPWAFTSYSLRFVLLAAFTVAAVGKLAWIGRTPKGAPPVARHRVAGALTISTVLAMLLLDTLAFRGRFYPGTPVELTFPLMGGGYYVLQGGNSPITNPFHRSAPSGRFAVDLVKLNRLGNRARRLIPVRLSDYEIFGDVVYSPCGGTVVRARDGLPDNHPPQADTKHPEGNHVVLSCQGVELLIAHLMPGSVLPREGTPVSRGEPLARVGNSGNSSEPHLHLQANRPVEGGTALAGEAVPMRFDGRFLSMNDVMSPLTFPPEVLDKLPCSD